MKLKALVLLLCVSAAAETPVAHQFSAPCSVVKPKTIAFFEQHNWRIDPANPCPDCFTGETRKPTDANGHRMFSNRNIIKQYTTYNIQHERPAGPAWIVHTQLGISAKLRFAISTADTCTTELAFTYGWYGAEMMLGVPIDGDRAGGKSNLQLERAYLDRIDKELRSKQTSLAH